MLTSNKRKMQKGTQSSMPGGNGTPAEVPVLGLSRFGHFPAYNRACSDGRPRGN